MKIKEYSKATSIAKTDSFVIETSSGTKQIEAQTLGFGGTTSSSEVIPVNRGGTGQTSIAAARNAFGLGNTTGALPVANGGTGVTSLAAARSAMGLGNTTGALPVANGGTGVTTDAAIGLKAYPVGALYISYNSTSPASRFGGTWTQITGRFLRAANDVATGGADTVTLTSAQLPSHTHTFSGGNPYTSAAVQWPVNAGGTTKRYIIFRPSGAAMYDSLFAQGTSAGSTTAAASGTNFSLSTGGVGATGSGTAHSNMPAYQDVYVWRRTA